MKKASLVYLAILCVMTMLLTGCIFPFWLDGGGPGHGPGPGPGPGGHHEDGGDRGPRGGGGRY